jgi:uncharacterized heparinase superfamily protein
LDVCDKIIGKYKSAISRFYIHPSIQVYQQANELVLQGRGFVVTADLTGMVVVLKEAEWAPQFGLTISNKVVEIEFISNVSSIRFSWKAR